MKTVDGKWLRFAKQDGMLMRIYECPICGTPCYWYDWSGGLEYGCQHASANKPGKFFAISYKSNTAEAGNENKV